MSSGSSLAFQRLSRDTPTFILGVKIGGGGGSGTIVTVRHGTARAGTCETFSGKNAHGVRMGIYPEPWVWGFRIHLIPIRPLRAPGVPTSLQFRDGCNPPILLLRIPLGGVLSAADAPPARRLSSISKDHLNYMRGGTPCPPPLTSMSENIIFPALLDQAPWTRPIAAVVEMQTAFSSVGKRGKGDSSHGVGGAIEARGPGVWRDEGVPAAERTGHSRGAGHLCVARAWRELAMFPF
eukprot:gene10982-biopygen9375